MAELDFLESFGFSEQELRQPETAYEKMILEISNQLTQDLRAFIQDKVHNTGALMASVIPFPTGKLSFEIQADEYYAYQDQGVNAAPEVPEYDYKRARVQGSVFSFKYGNPGKNMTEAIQKWKGGSMSRAWATARSIKHHGITPKRITENVITDDVLNKIASDLATVTGLMFTVSFTKSTETWQ